jgi:hypothetical protein
MRGGGGRSRASVGAARWTGWARRAVERGAARPATQPAGAQASGVEWAAARASVPTRSVRGSGPVGGGSAGPYAGWGSWEPRPGMHGAGPRGGGALGHADASASADAARWAIAGQAGEGVGLGRRSSSGPRAGRGRGSAREVGWGGASGRGGLRKASFPFVFLHFLFLLFSIFLLSNLFTINELHIKRIHTKAKHHTKTNIYFRMMHQSLFL